MVVECGVIDGRPALPEIRRPGSESLASLYGDRLAWDILCELGLSAELKDELDRFWEIDDASEDAFKTAMQDVLSAMRELDDRTEPRYFPPLEPETLMDIGRRHPKVQVFIDFVEACERREAETDEPVVVWADR